MQWVNAGGAPRPGSGPREEPVVLAWGGGGGGRCEHSAPWREGLEGAEQQGPSLSLGTVPPPAPPQGS